MLQQTIQYASSRDQTGPLYADVALMVDDHPKPLVLVMHGYNGSRKDVKDDLAAFARRGVVAIGPDMRGCGQSAGRFDSSGLDIHDAIDAAGEIIRLFPGQVDPLDWNIVGYSGGGGNAIAAGCRFPDLFKTAVSFFGISDYAWWHASKGRPDCNRVMEKAVGGPPDSVPARYEARNMTPAAGNSLRTNWHFFWDEQESQCPPGMIDDWIAAYRAAGGTKVHRHVSRRTDSTRYHHGYRKNHADLCRADDLFFPDLLKPLVSGSLDLPPQGELVVPGYLVTRRFNVFLGDGQAGCARISYQISPGGRVQTQILDNPRQLPVEVRYPQGH